MTAGSFCSECSVFTFPPARRLLIPLILLWVLASCDVVTSTAPSSATSPPRPLPTLFPTSAELAPALPGAPTAETVRAPDSGWQLGAAGVELRRLLIDQVPNRPPAPVTILRIDPGSVHLRVAYTPERPLSLRSWFASEHPLAAINGGFFRDDLQPTALLISDGTTIGSSYEGFGGMLAVGPAGEISIRPLRDQPYDPDEELAQAIQSFPMLVFPGGSPAPIEEDGQRARRSAVALDRSGRLLLIACPTSGFTLRGLAEWLAGSDLDVDRALNLDGGSSTGMFVDAGGLSEAIDSFGTLPIVLLVEAK
jgi:uncharacterized protein YigE (DUF2233 family)